MPAFALALPVVLVLAGAMAAIAAVLTFGYRRLIIQGAEQPTQHHAGQQA
jgi:hypothetical protein